MTASSSSSWIDSDGRAAAPWRASTEPVAFKLDGYTQRAYAINSGNLVVAYAFAGRVEGSRPDGLPNARLIAAAPQMLEALREMVALSDARGYLPGQNVKPVKIARALLKELTP